MASFGYYKLEATAEGYNLAWVGKTITVNLTQEGGGSPLEPLYGQVERLFNDLRSESTKSVARLVEPTPEKEPESERQARMNIGGQGELYGSH